MWNSFANGIYSSTQEVWGGIALYAPKIIGAIVLIIIGLLIAGLLEQVVAQLIRASKIDGLVRKAGAEGYLTRAGVKLDIGKFIGAIVKWFIILVVVIQALSILNLSAVTTFLQSILHYLPSVVVAVLILIAGFVIGEAMDKVVVGGARAAQLGRVSVLGATTRWAIWIFSVIVALYHLGIAAVFSETVFTAVVAALALAFGLAFGLGGQQAASEIIANLRREVSEKR